MGKIFTNIRPRIKCGMTILTILVLAFVLTGCSKQAGVDENSTYYVRNVVDGDTVELGNGRRVRYIGIDTPETRKRTGNGWVFDPEEYAVSAKELNWSLVYRKNIKLESDVTKKDKYGRWLAYVFTDDGLFVNKELIERGYATVYTFPPNLKYYEVLIEAQKYARMNKLGLWSKLEYIQPQQGQEYTGKFVAISGKIIDVYIAPKEIFLYFDKDRRHSVVATIYTSNLPLFSREGIDPIKQYKGKNVEIVGKIEYKDGPEILIDNPTQIRVLDVDN